MSGSGANAPGRIVIASRESALALWQARHIASRLAALYPRAEIRILGLTTEGDRRLDASLAKIGGKGLFCQQSDPYCYEAVGGSYFDMKRERLIGDGHLVFFDDGDAVSVLAEAEPVRSLLISGRPIREPIAWHGPIVMNTQEELRIAFEELERKTFIKDRG